MADNPETGKKSIFKNINKRRNHEKIIVCFCGIVFSASAAGFTIDYNSIQSIYGIQDGSAEQAVPVQPSGKNTGLYDFKPKAAATPAAVNNSLGEIVVTARKMEEYEGLVTKSMDIISEEKIKASGAVKLEDVLFELPGLSVLKYGSYEGLSSLNMRGASSNSLWCFMKASR